MEHYVPKSFVKLESITEDVFMIFEFESVQQFLWSEFHRRVRANERYSLRGFAKHLHLSPGELSEILRGKRQLSLKSALKISNSLGLNDLEKDHVFDLIKMEKSKGFSSKSPKIERRASQKILNEDQFRWVSDWYHFAILNLMDSDDFEWEANWISSRLGITRTQAQLSLNLLLRLGIVIVKNGKYQMSKDFILSTQDIPSSAIRHYHRQILEKAILSLEEQSPQERDITGIGFAVDTKHLSAIKKEISDFQDRLIAKYSRGSKKEVYQLEIAFFKLTTGGFKNGQ